MFRTFANHVFVIVLLLTTAHATRAQIVVANFDTTVNDRFSNSSDFILDGFDVTGVGRVDGGARWATAISRNVVVSANHARPSLGDTITFNTNNDPNGPTVSRTITSSLRVTNTSAGTFGDVWLGVLDGDLPASIASYSFLDQPLSFGLLPSLQTEAYFFGRPSGATINTGQTVGTNRITGFWEDFTLNGGTLGTSDYLYATDDPPGAPNYLDNEASLQVGDSGAPVFVADGSDLLLLGTNALRQPNALNYLGNEADEINAFISVNATASVPEPSCCLVLSALMGPVLLRRRR